MQTLKKYRYSDPVPSSAVVWRGRSAFDGSPIVAIVTGLHGDSKNGKTGRRLAQLFILCEDASPLDAIMIGLDEGICGDCPARGTYCYVRVAQSPTAVYHAYTRGSYVSMRPADVATHLASKGMGIRIGAYGDGAAVPVSVLESITHGIFHTGYTHAWRKRPDLAPFLMASADSAVDQTDASESGWRTFRVRRATEDLAVGEIACPASEEAGRRTSCDSCALCDGARDQDLRKSIAIIVHGAKVGTFLKMATV